jgi:hypothetical protein
MGSYFNCHQNLFIIKPERIFLVAVIHKPSGIISGGFSIKDSQPPAV